MKWMMTTLLGIILLTGCERNDLCYSHPHDNVYVEVNWDSISENLQNSLPEGVRISLYSQSKRKEEGGGTGSDYTFYRSTYGGAISAVNGDYGLLVFNSDTEMIQLRGMENPHTAEAYLTNRTRKPYSTKAISDKHIYYMNGSVANSVTKSEELMTEPDRFFATHYSLTTINTDNPWQADTLYAYPKNRVLMVTLTVQVEGLKGAASCRGSLSGVARGLLLASGKCTDKTSTVIFDMEKRDDTFLSKTIKVFGINKSPEGTPADERIQHIVQLEFRMRDNTIVEYEAEVTGQINFDAVRPEAVIPLVIKEIELPEVDVPDTPDSGFDADINGWDDEEIIIIK